MFALVRLLIYMTHFPQKREISVTVSDGN